MFLYRARVVHVTTECETLLTGKLCKTNNKTVNRNAEQFLSFHIENSFFKKSTFLSLNITYPHFLQRKNPFLPSTLFQAKPLNLGEVGSCSLNGSWNVSCCGFFLHSCEYSNFLHFTFLCPMGNVTPQKREDMKSNFQEKKKTWKYKDSWNAFLETGEVSFCI